MAGRGLPWPVLRCAARGSEKVGGDVPSPPNPPASIGGLAAGRLVAGRIVAWAHANAGIGVTGGVYVARRALPTGGPKGCAAGSECQRLQGPVRDRLARTLTQHQHAQPREAVPTQHAPGRGGLGPQGPSGDARGRAPCRVQGSALALLRMLTPGPAPWTPSTPRWSSPCHRRLPRPRWRRRRRRRR